MINAKLYNVEELHTIMNLGNTVHTQFRSTGDYSVIGADTAFEIEVANEMLAFKDFTSLSNYYTPYFSKKDSQLNSEIQTLRLELEKKLLELQ